MKQLEYNRNVTVTRLQGFFRRLSREKDILHGYDSAVQHFFKDGHAEWVKTENHGSETKYNMPHRAVIRETSTTTELGMVFDA